VALWRSKSELGDDNKNHTAGTDSGAPSECKYDIIHAPPVKTLRSNLGFGHNSFQVRAILTPILALVLCPASEEK